MLDLDTHDDLAALADMGYLQPKFFAPDHWAAVIHVGSFSAIVDGNRAALMIGYLNRWLYNNLADAARALHEWSGEGAPREAISAQISDDVTVWP